MTSTHNCDHQCPMFSTTRAEKMEELLGNIDKSTGRIEERLNSLDHEIYGNGKTGLIERLENIEAISRQRPLECDTKFNAIREIAQQAAAKPAEEVKKWRWMLAGVGLSGLTIGGGIEIVKALVK